MIDLRSDTVTKPTQAMRKVMVDAEVGDDVWGDDPSVNRLEAYAAEITGMEAGLFVPSGTQSNLVGILSHCQRGEEYIVGQQAHTYKYEGGGAAVLGSIQPQPVELEPDGTMPLGKIRAVIKPDDFHYAISKLLCLENTIGGKVLPMEYISAATSLASDHKLGNHLDGARLFNAVVRLGCKATDITRFFDSVSICLSKGLGAPVGSVLCGPADFIKTGRRWRKMLGGGMRQAGIIAAAGLYALENNIDRLAEDHDNAALLGKALAEIDELDVSLQTMHTNMVFFKPRDGRVEELTDHLASREILIEPGSEIRLVTHMQVSADDVLATAEAIKAFYQQS
ncbi:MAG: low-specificity L-threonine aldolase [Gammaproteobacteria bacterium]|nr:low-specificity L-threonine aldolase [Gammaproteobacteria bacterium]